VKGGDSRGLPDRVSVRGFLGIDRKEKRTEANSGGEKAIRHLCGPSDV
jgi:hypothetical protein